MAQEATPAPMATAASTLSSRTRRNCCRLCLAPDNECISILNSFAADKEPLAAKIQNCVSIKINPNDRLSLRICHHCISYLNSWQSFKNRCLSAQNKQRSWFGSGEKRSFQFDSNNLSITTTASNNANNQQQQQDDHLQQMDNFEAEEQQQQQQHSSLSASILDGISTLKKRKSLTVYPLPALQIKDEPMDEDEIQKQSHDETDDIMDPTLFLERTEVEGDEELPSSNFDYSGASNRTAATLQTPRSSAPVEEIKDAKCRACNLTFSTRANARRHERNLHPNLFKMSSTPIQQQQQQQQQPSAALQAALQLQRAVGGALDISSSSNSNMNNMPSTSLASQMLLQSLQMKNESNTAGEVVNYDDPENHRHLLTDEKIIFMLQNEEFLQQYQQMTCRCCNRRYDTYKNFMAHMRKKYTTLPRNLCFNCLKLNGSKALFISHLKRRNCVNLYRLLRALMAKNEEFATAVAATASSVPEKMRAKELLVNKTYECKLCPKQFRLKLEFRTHVNESHCDLQRKDATPNQCTFCGIDFEDATERKRHYNNMDCIVMLRCGTCDAKFENHQKFLDHVYQQHLSGFGDQSPGGLTSSSTERTTPNKLATGGGGGASSTDESRHSMSLLSNAPKTQYFSRMPQSCPICGQQYNNYNNVLRHMESKHPDQLPQTYKCVKCGVGFPRLSNLREHMSSVHASEKVRQSGFEYIVNAEATKVSEAGGNSYTGRYDYVMKDLMSITNGGTSAADEDNDIVEQAAKKMRMDSSSNGNSNNAMKECPVCKACFNNNIGLSNHMRSHTAAALSAATANANLSNNNKAAVGNSGSNINMNESLTANSSQVAMLAHQNAVQQAILKRSMDQAADRRFRRMRCRICQRRFSSKKSYRFHMLKDHQIRNVQFIKCQLCEAEFAYEKGLKVHMFKIHNTLMKDEMMIKQYECDICALVYREEQQLLQHKKSVHGNEQAQALLLEQSTAAATTSGTTPTGNLSGMSTPIGSGVGINNTSVLSAAANALDNSANAAAAAAGGPLYWYQCKYCPSNFNTNKKLAIHINSHDEFDSNDYSCKDCGNVYSGRKSLWVHRYKKHPQIPDPAECVLCKKIFFDAQMLAHHKPTCNRKPITATGALADGDAAITAAAAAFKHRTGDDEDESAAAGNETMTKTTNQMQTVDNSNDVEAATSSTSASNSNLRMKLPEVACAMCGKRFTDQDLFSKHLAMHEQELYTDNPLAAMFDMGPTDPNQFFLDRVNDMGEYACDLCSKTFTQMTALKVHRKWHFRGDSKQNPMFENDISSANVNSFNTQTNLLPPAGLQAVGLMPISRLQHQQQPQQTQSNNIRTQTMKNQKIRRELKCEYCTSTFISNNNLRRHMYELHQDEVSNLPKPPKINTDPYLQCRRCNMLTFSTKSEWIEHKVADARVTKPFGPFQWGCDLCGAYVSRKEKLINHIYNHAKEREIVPIDEQKKLLAQQSQQQQQQAQAQAQAQAVSMVKSEAMQLPEQANKQSQQNTLLMPFEMHQADDDDVENDNDNDDEDDEDDDEEQSDNDTSEPEQDEEYEQQIKNAQADESNEEEHDDEEEEEEEDEDEDEEIAQSTAQKVATSAQSTDDSSSSSQSNSNSNTQMDYDETNNNSDSNEMKHVADDIADDDVDNIIEMVDDTYDMAEELISDTNEDAVVQYGNIKEQQAHEDAEFSKKTNRLQQHYKANTENASNDMQQQQQQIKQKHYNDNAMQRMPKIQPANEMLSSDDEDDDEDDDEQEVELKTPTFPCELCQIGFKTHLELQRHVKMHFLNGPTSVKFAEMRPKVGTLNKSRSSSSSTDAVSVSLS